MKRTLSTLLAAALVLVMLTAGAVPALAATTYTPIGGSTTFVKNLVVDSDSNIPDITFAYTIN